MLGGILTARSEDDVQSRSCPLPNQARDDRPTKNTVVLGTKSRFEASGAIERAGARSRNAVWVIGEKYQIACFDAMKTTAKLHAWWKRLFWSSAEIPIYFITLTQLVVPGKNFELALSKNGSKEARTGNAFVTRKSRMKPNEQLSGGPVARSKITLTPIHPPLARLP